MNNKLAKLIKKAESLRAQNKLSEALALYKQICKIDTKNLNAWFIYGSVAGNMGKLDIAETAFKNACKINNGFNKQDELLLQVLELQGKYHEAIDILLKFSKSRHAPKDIDLRIGVLYGKTDEFEKSISWLRKYTLVDSNNIFAHHCLASAYEAENNFEEAENHFKAALAINSNDHTILNNYAALLQKMGEIDSAIKMYNRSISSNNQYPISRFNLGDLLLCLNEDEKALKLFTRALEIKPDYVEAVIGQGRSYQARGANLYALKKYEEARTLDPSIINIYIFMAQAHTALGHFDDALESLQAAIKLDSEHVEARSALAEIYEKRGSFDIAEEIIRPLLKSDPGNRDVVIVYASLCKKLNECDQAIRLINNITNDESVSTVTKFPLHFKAGKILDGMKQYDEAFHHYSLANKFQDYNYDEKVLTQSYENITTLFSKNSIASLPKSTTKTNAPIFIVGMPRSGTTLVEQIISSLPDVYGAGELPYLSTLSRRIAGDFLSGKEPIIQFENSDPQFLNTLAEDYIQSTYNKANNEPFFTDKMPHNFAMIGLINILFPESKIIHCKRNPIDNCLSIFFSDFNSRHPYACNLKNLAEYYTDYYEKLMKYWHDASQVSIYDISYEDIINDQEGISRKLIDFCDLKWNDACLDFHKSNRDVATISYDQVRQPIYNRSVERWRNYEEHIGPLLEHFKEYR